MAGAVRGEFALSERREGRTFVFVGTNSHPCAPYHAVIRFDELINYRASVSLPARVVVPAHGTEDLFRLEPVKARERSGYRVSVMFGLGDPRAEPDLDHMYLLPFEHGTKRVVGQGYLGKFTHASSYALDFNMDEGMAVCAARGGVVVEVKEDSTVGGPGPAYNDSANYVIVLHADGSWAEYAHLKPEGAKVSVRDRVTAGQVIALSGNTGRSNGPHLHFSVKRATWGGAETFPTAFHGKDGKAITLAEDTWYYAYHPGGAPFDAVLGTALVEAELENRRDSVPLDGEITFRSEQIDNRTLIFCRNGTRYPQAVTVRFTKIVGFEPSKRVPHMVNAPSGTEVYVLMLTKKTGVKRAFYELAASAKPIIQGR